MCKAGEGQDGGTLDAAADDYAGMVGYNVNQLRVARIAIRRRPG
jgi:hypothetical protein